MLLTLLSIPCTEVSMNSLKHRSLLLSLSCTLPCCLTMRWVLPMSLVLPCLPTSVLRTAPSAKLNWKPTVCASPLNGQSILPSRISGSAFVRSNTLPSPAMKIFLMPPPFVSPLMSSKRQLSSALPPIETDDTLWTLQAFQEDHFTKANKECHCKLRAQTAGYHGAHQTASVTAATSPVPTPTAVPSFSAQADGITLYYCWLMALERTAPTPVPLATKNCLTTKTPQLSSSAWGEAISSTSPVMLVMALPLPLLKNDVEGSLAPLLYPSQLM
jgi:hypothetical protein